MKEVLEELKSYLMESKVRMIKICIITLLVVVGSFVFFNKDDGGEIKIEKNGSSNENSISKSDNKDIDDVAKEEKNDIIIVDVTGEVENPMVAELPVNSRIDDAINAAGGLTKKADITKINRAEILKDGQKINIPTKGKVNVEETVRAEYNNGEESARININTASAERLKEIPGVGEVTAKKILEYRSKHGYFKKPEDIKNIKGIGDKTFLKMKNLICV